MLGHARVRAFARVKSDACRCNPPPPLPAGLAAVWILGAVKQTSGCALMALMDPFYTALLTCAAWLRRKVAALGRMLD